MDVSSAMQWWEEWQLRFLVLGSLFMHMFLAYAERLRRKPKLRAFLWLAYVGSDALSIYALATLFGRQKKLAVDGGSRGLEVIWAPILLVHLSGQWTVTAYSLEDNELWRRHVLTLMTQVTIALYVFCKWWSGGGKLLAAAVLQFIVGIVRFAQKPWLLRRASFNALKADSSLPRPRKGGIVASLWTWCTIDMYEFEEAKKVGWRERQERESLHKFVEEASKSVLLATQTETADDEDVLENLGSAIGHTNYFVDVIAPYSARLRELQNFIKLDCPSGNKTINNYIHTKYLAMYSGLRAANSPLSGILRQYLLPSLSLASVVLFARSHKDGYSVNDIWVTYIVFCYAAVQEFFPWLGIIHFCFCILTRPKCMGPLGAGWRMVPQYNLLSYCAHKKKPTILMKLATFSFLRELVSKHACIQEVDSWSGIIWTVFSYTKFGWTEYIRGDVARYKRFNNFRGQLALSRHGLMERIGWSVSMRFNESVLVWHIATDLCVYCLDTSPQGEETARVSKDISSYMMYLFSIHPEMLIPGARSAFFYLAIEDIELLLKDSEVKLDKEKILAREILKARKTEDTPIHDACKLVEALMELDEEERWTVIGKVWVELLCYSTSRCRGYLHAKGLGEGGLFGTWIWVMWSFMGMETWVERYHRLEDPEEGGGMGQKGEEGRAGAAEEGQQQDGGAQAPGHPQEPHILVPLSSIEISIA